MHGRMHRHRLEWLSSSPNGVKCTVPGRLEEIFIEDLAAGQSVREIADHRGFTTRLIVEVLSNASAWFKTRERDLGKYFAAMAIDRAIENIHRPIV